MNLDDYRLAVSEELAQWPATLSRLVEDPSEGAAFAELQSVLGEAVAGGKRTRAALAYAGYAAAGGNRFEAIVDTGCALELFQASALVHDDIIDNSPLRRGVPAAHAALTALHEERKWVRSPRAFGVAGAIVAGDLLLAAACERFAQALSRLDGGEAAGARALRIFNSMMVEVAYGQYLDVREENLPLDTAEPISRALAIVRHKSARYSVELPLALGATLAGGGENLVASLRSLGLNLGIAFQLRDDDLGVFGSPARTGKPAGGDISEGKRTVLLALMRQRLSGSDLAFLDSRLGNPLSADEAARIQHAAVACGARQAHEAIISRYEMQAEEAYAALADACEAGEPGAVTPAGLSFLRTVMDELAGRQA